MKIVILVFFLAVVFMACNKDQKSECASGFYAHSFATAKSLDTSANNIAITNGNDLVFTYYHKLDSCPNLLGARVAEAIYFEIPSGLTSFNYNSSSLLLQAKTTLHLTEPLLILRYPKRVTSGSIEGTMTNANTWHIKATLQSPYSNEVFHFEEDFSKN